MRLTAWLKRTAGALALASVAAVPAAAQFQLGDVFASVNSGRVNQYRGNGTFVQTLNTGQGGFTTGSAFDGAGNLYVTNFSASSVSKFDNNGALLGLFGSGYNTPESIVFDKTGNIYVGNTGGGIRQFDPSGNLLQTFAAGRVDWMDLTADQTTMYITTEGSSIARFDLASQTFLTPFATGLGGEAFALRILGNGGVLLANGPNVLQFDPLGNITKTYTVGGVDGFFALNLDPDGTSFWTGSFQNDVLYKFDIASGSLLETIDTGLGGNNLFGVSVFGEITQGGPPPSTVPEPGTVTLLATGLLAVAAAARRRRNAT